jgi:hypothetical protein
VERAPQGAPSFGEPEAGHGPGAEPGTPSGERAPDVQCAVIRPPSHPHQLRLRAASPAADAGPDRRYDSPSALGASAAGSGWSPSRAISSTGDSAISATSAVSAAGSSAAAGASPPSE